MPMASRMPFCASTLNSCGRTCRTSRSSGSVMLRAASTARRTSSRSMSRGRCPRVMPPRLFTPRTCAPATPISASSTGTLATPSASSTARRIELTVESRLTIRPLRKPLDSAAPSARNLTTSPSISAIRIEVLVLPISSPTRYLSFFANPPLPELFCSRCCRARAGVGIHDHLPRILQIDRLQTPGMGLPLRKIVDEHLELSGKIARAEMDGDGLRVRGAGQPGQDHAQILGNRKVHFADSLRRTAAHEFDILHKFLKKLHAFFALIARQVVRYASDDRKLQIRIAWTFQDHAVRINQLHFVAIASESNRSAFRKLDANAVRENAMDAGGFDPGDLFELAAAKVERDLQDAEIVVLRERSQDSFARDHVIASQFDLLGLEQQHGRRIKKKPSSVIRADDYGSTRSSENQDSAVKRPAAATEFFAANLDGLLAAQVARLFVGNQLRPVTLVSFCRSGGVPLHGLQAFQTTTSFSKATP